MEDPSDMAQSGKRIERVAHAVAEGRPVDWQAELGSGLTTDERRNLEQLQLIARLARNIDDKRNAHEQGERVARVFDPPQWSLVLASGAALESLCARYWIPVYAEVRLAGHDPRHARELTESFFHGVLEHRALDAANGLTSKFRTFLKVSIKRFLAGSGAAETGHPDHRHASRIVFNLDAAERHCALERIHKQNPAGVFDRCWARVLMGHVLGRLREETVRAHSAEHLQSLSALLIGSGEMFRYADLAVRWNTTEKSIRLAVHRLRAELRSLLREEVAHTVQDPGDVSEEIRFLLSVMEA